MEQIQLGDKVRCRLTGFTGIAVAKTEFINGCVQWSILTKVDKSNKMPEEVGVDEQSLEIITPKKRAIKKKESGGPITRGLRLRGY